MRRMGAGYREQRARIDLAVRMIGHEARTRKIRRCTGLSDDRIRRLHAHYFKPRRGRIVKRRRGKSPRHPAYYVRNAHCQAESTTLILLFGVCGLLRIVPNGPMARLVDAYTMEYGERICLAYEIYKAIHPHGHISFEHAWSLLDALVRAEELSVAECKLCDNLYLRDVLGLDTGICPCCRLKGHTRGRRRTARASARAVAFAARR